MNQPKNNHEKQQNIASIRPDYTTEDYLELMGLDISDFKGKNIVSIGGGFGMLEMDLARTGTKVEIVDPIYNNKKEIPNIIENLIKTLRVIAETREHIINQTKKDLSKSLTIIQEQRKHLSNFYDEYINNELPETLVLNSSNGKDIKGIESDSQDYIFINNVLFHFPEEINEFLSEADKILKPGGTIFIIDYTNELKDLQEYFKSNRTHKTTKEEIGRYGAFCGSLKKGEYNQVKFFLERKQKEKEQNMKKRKYTI